MLKQAITDLATYTDENRFIATYQEEKYPIAVCVFPTISTITRELQDTTK